MAERIIEKVLDRGFLFLILATCEGRAGDPSMRKSDGPRSIGVLIYSTPMEALCSNTRLLLSVLGSGAPSFGTRKRQLACTAAETPTVSPRGFGILSGLWPHFI